MLKSLIRTNSWQQLPQESGLGVRLFMTYFQDLERWCKLCSPEAQADIALSLGHSSVLLQRSKEKLFKLASSSIWRSQQSKVLFMDDKKSVSLNAPTVVPVWGILLTNWAVSPSGTNNCFLFLPIRTCSMLTKTGPLSCTRFVPLALGCSEF